MSAATAQKAPSGPRLASLGGYFKRRWGEVAVGCGELQLYGGGFAPSYRNFRVIRALARWGETRLARGEKNLGAVSTSRTYKDIEDLLYASARETTNAALARGLLGSGGLDSVRPGFGRHQPLPCIDVAKTAYLDQGNYS